jgi:DNA-binding protein HU-beta
LILIIDTCHMLQFWFEARFDHSSTNFNSLPCSEKMAPAMKAMKTSAKPMTKGALVDALATAHEVKKSQCTKMMATLAEVATEQVKTAGVFTIPGVCRIKTRVKPATKAGTREMFGKMTVVKAKPAKTVVKAFPVAALKKSI